MDFDFIIPLSIDGLQESSSSRQYSVAQVSTSKEIPQKLQECIQSYRKDGPKFILDQNCFDSLYSVLVNFKSVEEETLSRAWELMIKVMTAQSTKIHEILEDEVISEYKMWLLILKMNSYIVCNLTEAFESKFNEPSDILIGKKSRKTSKRSESGLDWERERERILIQLYSLIQAPLNRLWDPPVIDEDYINLIANCCYKILESSSMNLVRTKEARESIFQIIGTLVKKFNHGLACSLKLMQLLQHFEHLVGPCAQGIILILENYDVKGVLQEMIREVVKIDSRDLTKDSMGLRNFSQFFMEVAEKKPHIFIPSLSLLVSFLQQEAYCMRNCVLYIMGSIVLRVLTGENLDSKSKALRDECLSYLLEFIHDSNSFVRSKVLQIWEELVKGQAVPLAQQQPILKKIVQRLRDKSSNVRKYALHLLAAFLKANPFAAKLPLEDLKTQFEEEMKNLQEMRPGSSLDNEDDEETDPSIEALWIALVSDIIKTLKKVFKNENSMECSDEDSDESEDKDSEESVDEELEFPSLPENFTLNDGISSVGKALLDKRVEVAVNYLRQVINQYPNDEVLQIEVAKEGSTYQSFSDLSEKQKDIFLILHRIFTSYMKMKIQMDEEKNPSEEKGKERMERKKREEEYKKQKILCCYLRDSVNFAREIQKGLPDICQLLASRQTTDIMEAIDFFVTAFEFGVLDAMTGVRKMLGLIWCKEQTVKEAVVSAYRRLYININTQNERSRALLIVQNLTALITGATLGEITSMEEIVSQFVKSGDIDKHCITLLWEKFTKALPDTSDDDSKASLILLTMASNSEKSIISSNLNVLIEVGLGERASQDFSVVKNVCVALCKMAPVKLKTDDPNPPYRMPQDHEMIKKLTDILIQGIMKTGDKQYSPMAFEAINTIYLLSEHPDIICGNIIQKIIKDVKEKSKVTAPNDGQNVEESFGGILVSMPVLARFITIVGHVALRQLIHMDTYIFTELKRRNFLREEQEQKSKQKKKKRSSGRKSSNVTSASEISISKIQEGDIDEEMGLTGAVADDMEADFIRNVCETETVKGENLLSLLRPLIESVCTNPTKYSDPNLRAAAGLALAKFMLVSSECCEKNLQLLFTILEKSKEPVIRANTIIAIGDLTFRFPNLVEPWTPRIYARLRDESTFVRRNTLTVLTHLILNDQVKVKGQISEIALCLSDHDLRIAAMTKLFFGELAKKGNALYNVLPDIISRLSDTEVGTTETNFRSIVSHIFSLIIKDRQLEAFVEKLCLRLQASSVPRQWRDLTYCLSLLPYTEKGIRKLSENFSCYSNKLHEEQVYELLLSIMSNAKKFAKPELKGLVDELESRLEECHKKNVEDEGVASKALNARNKVKKLPKKSKRKSKENDSDSDSEEEFESRAETGRKENIPPPSRPRRSTRTRPSLGTKSSDSEMEADDDDDVFVKPGNTRVARKTRVR